MAIRMQNYYKEKVVPEFMKMFGLTNKASVPRVIKVVVNVGIAEPQHQDKALENMGDQLKVITGQQPKVTRAKKSIAGFSVREGEPIGLMVTLRGKRMYQFLDKLIHIVLPRVKDFQGVSRKAFDKAGNYSLGFDEQIVFPEIEYGKIDAVRGLQVTIVTNAGDPEKSIEILKLLGMPFVKEEDKKEGSQ